MFKRTFEVNMVKNNKKDNTSNEPEPTFADQTGPALEIFDRVVATASRGFVAYIVLDTVRKIAVNRLSK